MIRLHLLTPLLAGLCIAGLCLGAGAAEAQKKNKGDPAIEKHIRHTRLVFVRHISALEARLHREQFWKPQPLRRSRSDSLLGKTPKIKLPKTPSTSFEKVKK